MTWWQWMLLGLVFWALLVALICVLNYHFWNHVQRATRPMSCTGCQRHHVRADCPIHGIRV